MKITNLVFEYDDDGNLRTCIAAFELSNANDDYVNGRVVLDATELNTSSIVQTVHDKLQGLVQS